MFLFLRMVLAHFVADYPLQTNRVYCAKISSFKGQLAHALIHTVVFSLFLIPFWKEPLTWLFLLWITGSHLSFDILKVQLIDKTKIHPVITYTGDQLLHLLAASVVFLLPYSNQTPELTQTPIASLYTNDRLILFMIGLIVSTYFTTYYLACWHWAKKKLEHDDGYQLTNFQKYYGILERGLMFTFIVLCGNWGLISIPVLIAFRLPVSQWLQSRGMNANWIQGIPDMVGGTLITVVAAIIVQCCFLGQS